MAPLIKTSIQFLLSYAPANIQQKLWGPCIHPSSNVGVSELSDASISAVSWGYNRLDVYAIAAKTGDIAHKYWDGYQWGPSADKLEILGGGFDRSPSAVSDNSSRNDIFVAGKDSSLQHKYFDGYDWRPSATGWDGLTKPVGAGNSLSTTSWAPGRLDAFWTSSVDGGLSHVFYDGSSWQPTDGTAEDLGGALDSPPAAVTWGPDRHDVFAIKDEGLVHKYWDGSRWSDWETQDLTDVLVSVAPRVVTWGEKRLDVFVVNQEGSLIHIFWDDHPLAQVEYLGGALVEGTVAATTSLNRLDVVALGSDSHYYYKLFDGESWQPSQYDWYDKGGEFASVPSVVSWTDDADKRFDIFGVTKQGELGHQTWYGSGWYPDSNQWETLGGGLANSSSL